MMAKWLEKQTSTATHRLKLSAPRSQLPKVAVQTHPQTVDQPLPNGNNALAFEMSTAAAPAEAATAAAREETGKWEGFPPMITERRSFGAASDGDRFLYAVGGRGIAARTTAEVWDATTNEWTALPDLIGPDLIGPRAGCAAAVVGGKLFVVGGRILGICRSSVLMFDPDTGSWARIPPMRARRRGCAAAAFGGKLFVFGGDDGDGALASAEVFDPSNQGWTNLPSMSVRRGYCAAAVAGGRICVVGGKDEFGNHLDSIEIFDPHREAWSSAPPSMSCGRSGCAVAGWEDRLFVLVGNNGHSGEIRSAEAFDVGAGTWSPLPDIDNPRMGCAAVVVDGRIVVLGGQGGQDENYAMLRSCAAYNCQYHHLINQGVAAGLPRHQKDCLLQIVMVARQLDDERALRGERHIGPDLWWRVFGMLKVGDLI